MRRHAVLALAIALMLVPAASAKGTDPPPDPITVVGTLGQDSPEAGALRSEFAVFTARQGVEVVYERYDGVADLRDRVTGPEPPDMALVPQPGVLHEFAPYLEDLGRFVNERILRRDFGDYLIDAASVDGAVLGAPVKADLKSLVWYKPAKFEEYGYVIPQTFTELVALSDRMVADGRVPWCNYIESGYATGWLGTDWLEDLLLSTYGPEVYDQWVAHDILFQDARVEAAFEKFMQMIDTPGYVYERSLITTVPFGENAIPLEAGDCFMHKQASFFTPFLTEFDLEEFSTFEFPQVNAEFADWTLGAGVYLGAFDNREDVRHLARFMLSKKFGSEALADSGRWIMPNSRFDMRRYGDDLTRSFAETVREAIEADRFRFDGSDLMPSEVGAGEFWYAITDLLDGVRSLPEVLADIDAAWPS